MDIAAQLNARGGAHRTPQQIKDKWRKSSATAREEAAKEWAYAKTTGGGPSSTTYKDPTTEKILQLHQRAPNFFGIDDGIEMGLPVNMVDSNLGIDDNAQTEFVILNGNTNLLNQANSTIRAITLNSSSHPSYSITQYPREKYVSSAAIPMPTGKPRKSSNTRQTYQKLQMSVLKMEKSQIAQEKLKLMAETEKIELEKTLLKLQIKKAEKRFRR